MKVTITPESAAKLLHECADPHRRTIRDKEVSRYARDMKMGHWRSDLSTDPIFILRSPEGEPEKTDRLLNGHHRMAAVVEAGVDVSFPVEYVSDPRTVEYMDSGLRRTYTDILRLRGVPNPGDTERSVRLLYKVIYDPAWQPGSNGSEGTKTPSFYELDDVIAQARTFGESIAKAKNLKRKFPLTALDVPTLAVTSYLFSSRDATAEHEFWTQMLSPDTLYSGSPLLALRRRLISRLEGREGGRHKYTQRVLLSWVVKAWNAWRAGLPVEQIKYFPWEGFPEVG